MFSWQGRYDARDVDIRFVTRRLTPEMVLENYARGVFPMANPEFGVITWYCPKPRAVIPPERREDSDLDRGAGLPWARTTPGSRTIRCPRLR